MRKKLTISFLLIITFISFAFSVKTFNISQEKLNEFTKKYGEVARTRVLVWDKMVENAKSKDILHKLKDVNDFFNKIKYETDEQNWHKKDYWAAPFEFMGTGAGDCEDYAIAKYFTLRKLGVPDKKLRITYVKLLRQGTKYELAHMVLTYYHTPTATPVVLDNVNKILKLASKRPDLKPVYSFNAQGLWEAKNKGKTSQLVGKNNLKSWKDLMSRI
ncbi:transglutaminase family protein cysteine peptidase BTLCP [Arcobacter nitrofigilis DSM 7299]|uniref:Transglutaminase family protein cysteine peptidase BTLCP n=1 Tax=Arcobacter nitrofigilis (strain ATCC 33309 / DSM 7299 / CCUG 15893 / LMG 7604 / NCTC 12251 / CI) TaxID=572480 RepID=D5V2Q1_ARCNC|nr:transglutaminase-like cysteine peptidase [Arcobacter nitrofigilis]ADG92483.1 transglutaminase family protein cysteine peptidase BTLCP [Arcobacter nitrofigilis DSM 7299]